VTRSTRAQHSTGKASVEGQAVEPVGYPASPPAQDTTAGARPPARSTTSRILESALENISRIRSTFQGFDDGMRAFTQAVEARLELVHEYALSADGYIEGLETRLTTLQTQADQLGRRLDAAEMQTARLLSLYVATSQLHSTLDPEVVRRMIAEITINLLGADHFVVLLRSDHDDCWVPTLAERPEGAVAHLLTNDSYHGGDVMVDASLRDGVIRLGPVEGSSAIAAVPLLVRDEVVGILVLLKLLDHKKELTRDDSELLELLAMHAASALVLAQMYSSTDRKLRTLQGLVGLVRRQDGADVTPALVDALMKSQTPPRSG
jgi:hypothetical protein